MDDAAEIEARVAAAAEAVRESELLTKKLAALKAHEHQLDRAVEGLRQAARSEAADVEQLESLTLARLWAMVRGVHGETLTAERAEADVARLRHEEAKAQLDAVREQKVHATSRLRRLADASQAYQSAAAALDRQVRHSDDPRSKRLAEISEERGPLLAERRELDQAITAARRAITWLDRAATHLEDAGAAAARDVFYRGGIAAGLAKHDLVDKATAAATQADRELAALRAELADVAVLPSIAADLGVGPVSRFVDIWLDNLFSDLALGAVIHRSENAVRKTRRQVQDVLTGLTARDAAAKRRVGELDAERHTLLIPPPPAP